MVPSTSQAGGEPTAALIASFSFSRMTTPSLMPLAATVCCYDTNLALPACISRVSPNSDKNSSLRLSRCGIVVLADRQQVIPVCDDT